MTIYLYVRFHDDNTRNGNIFIETWRTHDVIIYDRRALIVLLSDEKSWANSRTEQLLTIYI